MEASASLTDYQLASQGNNQSYSVGGYLEWQLRPSLHLTLRGGPSLYEYSTPGPSGGNSALNSYYASLEASQQLTDYISQSLQINRSVQSGANQGSGYDQQLTAVYSANWQLTRRINVGVSGSYTDGQQPLTQYYYFFGYAFPVEYTENYQAYGGGLRASWQFTGHLAGTLGYNRSVRDSNLYGRGYTENSVSLQLNYTF